MLVPLFGSMGILPPSENSTYFLKKRLHLNLNISSLNKKSSGKMTNDKPLNLALVVQTLDSAIQWINIYPVDKYLSSG